MNYEVRLPLFEGPFDLLLFFIERDELDIHEVSLATITGEFLEYIQSMNSMNLELASEFIWVASTLMKIKARQLLPRPRSELEMGEMESEQSLMERLMEYKNFKNTLPFFIEQEAHRSLFYSRGNLEEDIRRIYTWTKENKPPEELQNLSLYQLLIHYQRVLNRNGNQEKEPQPSLEPISYSIEIQKKQILEWINFSQKIDFHTIQKRSKNNLQLVYSFLALLELVQEQILQIQVGLGMNNFWLSTEKPLD